MINATRIQKISRSPQELESALAELLVDHANGVISAGKMLRELRRSFFGVTQERFAQAIKISRRTLVQIEKDDYDSVALGTLNRAFRPFGMTWGVVPLSNRVVIKEMMRAIQDAKA